jgi:hypothetical protein
MSITKILEAQRKYLVSQLSKVTNLLLKMINLYKNRQEGKVPDIAERP